MSSNLCHKWKIVNSENFDEYMKAVGVTPENRALAKEKLSKDSNLCQEISINGDTWSIKTITSVGDKEITFKIGEEFDSKTMDGRPVKVCMTMDGDVLMETQAGSGVVSVIKRSVENSIMTMTMTADGVTCTRRYEIV